MRCHQPGAARAYPFWFAHRHDSTAGWSERTAGSWWPRPIRRPPLKTSGDDVTFLQQRPPHVEIADEVIESLERGGAVVALETAVVTHGLPEPANLDAVRRMEKAIRDAEATPGTCLMADGRLWIGATSDQIEAAAAEPGRQKASVRD